ncbi:C3H1-type domain-containing protein [Mycena venus]|uniref:C3H1-type domain-containing protein n=1 Tax=Mycena venus TaxID=2733690 RepID=A0A8H7CZU9_9AGAR|nr:C3H1-type domain-containing protein [Mycena venus]
MSQSDNVQPPSNPHGRVIIPAGGMAGAGSSNPQNSGGSQNPGVQPDNPPNLVPAGSQGNQDDNGGVPEGPQLPPAVQAALSGCELIVDQYHLQRLGKAEALHQIYQKLLGTGVGGVVNIQASFGSYLHTIEDHDASQRAAAERGALRQPPAPGGAGPRPELRRSPTPPAFEQPGGRPAALEAQYPWAVAEFIESSIRPLSPNLTRTLDIYKVLLQDPKRTKTSILTSARSPELPDSEWTNIVNGRPINLDAVLSGMFSTAANDERSESLGGGLELRFGAVAPTKVVSDAGTWIIAFDRARAATLFVFPHRAQELTDYRDYVLAMFAATNSLFHDRIITFDKAARKRVAHRRDLELTDFHQFADIKVALIDSVGVGVVDTHREPSSGAARKPKSEACNNWNKGRCTADAGTCRRLHVCNVCKVAGHKGPDCPERLQN